MKITKGIFCDNFGFERGPNKICKSVWHRKCYASHDLDGFHINLPEDGSGFTQVDKRDEMRFKESRDGDHLMCSFQCDLCLFYMLKGRHQIKNNAKDELVLVCIRRANLDAFWSKEPSTV